MKTSTAIGFKLLYDNPSTGETEQVYAQKTVPIENYSAEWYAQRDAAAILKQVSSVYRGNYTTSYAANNDYSKTTKEVWINAKGYSSNTNYLVWINRAYQHVNVFTGSKGNWKLTKSFIVGTGAASTPTPVGVTTVSYKLKGRLDHRYLHGSSGCRLLPGHRLRVPLPPVLSRHQHRI